MERIIKFLRKPRFTTKDEEKAKKSTFQWGWGWEWDPNIVEDDEMYWTLSFLGIINGIPFVSNRYRLFVLGAEELDAGGFDYSKATLRIKNWPKSKAEMSRIATQRLAVDREDGYKRLIAALSEEDPDGDT